MSRRRRPSRRRSPVWALLLVAAACGGSTSAAPPATTVAATMPGGWTAKASMLTGREGGGSGLGGAGTQLLDGRVLVVGGFDAADGKLSFDPKNYLAEAEIYDPVADSWQAVAPMHETRLGPAVATLSDGRALVAGGFAGASTGARRSVEIFDPATGAWAPGPDLATCHGQAGIVSLTPPPRPGQKPLKTPTDRLLVVGGVGCPPEQRSEASAEIFDAAKNRWTSVAPMHEARWGHSTTLLADGRVLVAGGYPGGAQIGRGDVLKSAEIYDPKADTWTLTLPMTLPRIFHAAGLLPNGQVMVAGGRTCAGRTCASPLTETLDPKTGAWAEAAPMASARAQGTSAVLGPMYGGLAGAFIVIGGGQQQSSEIYDPKAGDWLPAVPLGTMRDNAFAIQVHGGYLLAIGGFFEKGSDYSDTATVEQLGTVRTTK